MTSIEIRQKQEEILANLRDLKQANPKVKPDGWDAAMEECRKLGEQLDYALQSEEVQRRSIEIQAKQEDEARAKRDGKEKGEKDMTYEGCFKRYLVRPKNGRLSDEEERVLETRGTSTQVTSTDNLGGYLVPQSFSEELANAGLWSGGMMEACRIYTDPIGGTLKWPTGDDTANTGEIVTQGSAKNVIDMTFGNVLFVDYTIDSGIVKVSRELINDERVGLLQSVLAENLAGRMSRKINAVLTNGTGTSEPYGLTTAVTGTGLTTASATAITKSELMRMLYSVDKHYSKGQKVGWMMNRETLGYLRTLDFSTDTTHIFADIKAAGEPDMLLGYPVFVNNDLPALSGNAPVAATKHIYFGDFSKYVIRKIQDVAIERNDSAYWTSLTVGFMGWARLDGNLVDQGAIKALAQHS